MFEFPARRWRLRSAKTDQIAAFAFLAEQIQVQRYEDGLLLNGAPLLADAEFDDPVIIDADCSCQGILQRLGEIGDIPMLEVLQEEAGDAHQIDVFYLASDSLISLSMESRQSSIMMS